MDRRAGTLNVGFVNTVQTINNETGVWYGGVITGSGGLTVTGSGGWNVANQSILNLTGNNTYAGGTTVNNAVLGIEDTGGPFTNILPATTVLNLVNSGVFNMDTTNFVQTVAGLTGDPTGLVGTCNQSGAAGLIIDSTGNYTYNGAISAFTYAGKLGTNARISVTMSGSGSQTLTGSSAYAGGTTVSSGTLVLGNNAALGTGGLTANGGVTDLHGFNPTVSSLSGLAGLITNNGASNSLLTVNQGATTTFGGTISDGPTNKVALIKSGAGASLLGGSNAYSGTTAVNGGMLQFAMPNSLYAGNMANWTPANISVAGSATLAVNIGGPTDFTPAQAATLLTNLSASTSSSGLEANAAFGFDVTNATGTVTYSGQITDSTAGPLRIAEFGTGTLMLTGTNTYTGGTFVNSGTMIVTNPAGIEDGTNLTVGNASAFPAAAPIVPAPVAGLAAAAVPEPGTLALVAAAALSIGILRRKRGRGSYAKRPSTGC